MVVCHSVVWGNTDGVVKSGACAVIIALDSKGINPLLTLFARAIFVVFNQFMHSFSFRQQPATAIHSSTLFILAHHHPPPPPLLCATSAAASLPAQLPVAPHIPLHLRYVAERLVRPGRGCSRPRRSRARGLWRGRSRLWRRRSQGSGSGRSRD